MPRRDQEFLPGQFYHVYNRGCGKQRLFFSRGNYLFFQDRMNSILAEEEIEIVAWCLMPNHFHLLLRPTRGNLEKVIQRLSLSYAKAINRQRERTGALFEGRFRAVHVDREEYLLYLTRYLHRNPVEAGLVLSCEDWEFSGFREYLDPHANEKPTKGIILQEFGTIERYRKFVESNRDDGVAKIVHLTIDT